MRVLPSNAILILSRACQKASLSSPVLCKHQSTSTSLEANIFNDDHRQLYDTVIKVIDRDINPHVEDWEHAHAFPGREVFKKMGEVGVFGVDKSPDFGGLGLDFSYSMAVAEALGHIDCGGVPMAIAVQADMATPALNNFGSKYLKHQFLAPTIAGDQIACLGVSEQEAGSDVAGIQTTAKKEGDDYLINGGKMWITNGAQADWMCLLANTSQGHPHTNKSLIIVPMNTPGVQVARKIEKMGMHSSDTAQIFFQDVRVPKKHLIGEEGKGFTYQMLQFQNERLWAAAIILRTLDKAIEQTIEYCRDRKQYGGKVLDHQVVHFTLAELKTEVEALRSMVYRAVELKLSGKDVTLLASMCKYKAGILCRKVPDKCLQYWGGMGYSDETLVSRLYRDMRLISIAGGADEVMLSIISKFMGTLPTKKKSAK